MEKKRIICFGDSNTWGYDPVSGSRYDENTRWPMRMQQNSSLWKCQCGAENTGRFCEYCGQPRPF